MATKRISRLRRLSASDGLIALTGGPAGPIDRALKAGLADLAERRLARLAEAFGARLYVEIQRHGLDSERVDRACAHRSRRSLTRCRWSRPTSPISLNASDYEAHDALLCIADGALVSASERRRLTPEHRFKTRAEMMELFADLPEATEASVEIAMRCAYRPLDAKADPAALFRRRRSGGRRGSGAAPPGARGPCGAPRDAWPRAGT